MSFGPSWSEPFFEGYTPTPTPDPTFPISLGGRNYVIESKDYKRSYIDDLRQSTDDTREPTESAFNPEAAWRRGGSSWHLGCGQRDFDLESQIDLRSRFRSSLNLDVWTRQECSPLPAMTLRPYGPGTARPVGAVAWTNSGWYATFGAATYRSTNLGQPGSINGTQVYGSAATHIVQMGDRVYCRFTDSRIGRVTVGETTVTLAAVPEPNGADGCGQAIGRLLAWDRMGVLHEVHADDSVTPVWTHPWAGAGWRWDGVIDTPSGGFAWGSGPGGGAEMYRLTTDDVGAVATPVFAGSLPPGEFIHDMLYLQGMVVLATNLGFRVGQVAEGITYGPLVKITNGVHHLCADGRWVLFGWHGYEPGGFPDKYDPGAPQYTGWGRIDLSTFTSPLVPAFAPDLMVEGDMMIVACATNTVGDEAVMLFDDGMNGCRDRTKYPSTPVFVNTGRIRYGVYDSKLFTSVDPRVEPLPDLASISVDVSFEGTKPERVGELIGFGAQQSNEPFKLPYEPHEWAELTFGFHSGGNLDVSELPVLLRWTLRSVPNPKKAEEILLPVRLFERVSVDGDAEWSYDVASELKWLHEMCETQTPLEYADGPNVKTVYLNNMEAHAVRRTIGNDAWEGVCTLQLRTVI